MAKIRLMITKGGEIRYISHLDYAGTIERLIRRAKLPAAYSEGFNPHMKISFASALAVGVTSEAEYLDVDLTEEMNLTEAIARLKRQLPSGIEIKAAKYMTGRTQALMAIVNLATYQIVLPGASGLEWSAVEASITAFNKQTQVNYVKQSPKGRREIDIKEYMTEPVGVRVPPDNSNTIVLSLSIKITPGGSVKPAEVIASLTENFGLPVDKDSVLIHRTGLFVTDGQAMRTPMEM